MALLLRCAFTLGFLCLVLVMNQLILLSLFGTPHSF